MNLSTSISGKAKSRLTKRAPDAGDCPEGMRTSQAVFGCRNTVQVSSTRTMAQTVGQLVDKHL